MSQLSIAIKRVQSGAGEPIIINPGPWASAIVDLRSTVFPAFANAAVQDFYLLTFSDEGTYLVAVHRISGRVTDYISAWIYIPNTVEAGAVMLTDLAGYVMGALSGSELPLAQLEEVFGRQYPEREVPKYTVSSRPDQPLLAVDIDKWPLAEIMGERRFQKAYCNCSGVLLIPSPATNAPEVKQLSNLEELLSIGCRQNVPLRDILATAEFFAPDGKMIPPVMLLKKDSSLEIIAKSRNLVPLRFMFKARHDQEFIDIPSDAEWQIDLPMDRISVVDESGRSVNPRKINLSINGKAMSPYAPVSLPYRALTSAMVSVTADGYEPYSATHDLLSNPQPVRLIRSSSSVEGNIYVPGRGDIKVRLEGKGIDSQEPLPGYRYYPDNKSFEPKRPSKSADGGSNGEGFLKSFYGGLAIGAGIMFLIAAVVFVLFYVFSDSDDHRDDYIREHYNNTLFAPPVTNPVEEDEDFGPEEYFLNPPEIDEEYIEKSYINLFGMDADSFLNLPNEEKFAIIESYTNYMPDTTKKELADRVKAIGSHSTQITLKYDEGLEKSLKTNPSLKVEKKKISGKDVIVVSKKQ